MASKEYNLDKIANNAVKIADALVRIANVFERCETRYGSHNAICVVNAGDMMKEEAYVMRSTEELEDEVDPAES